MKLSSLCLHNFRGVQEENIDLFDYTLLVGPNNAGKSTIIDALRAFYNKDKFSFKKERDFPFVSPADDESWIELTFDLSDEEADSLAVEYVLPDNKLRVRKYFIDLRVVNEPIDQASLFGRTTS